MTRNGWQSILIRGDTKEGLKELQTHVKDSYDLIIKRLIKINKLYQESKSTDLLLAQATTEEEDGTTTKE